MLAFFVFGFEMRDMRCERVESGYLFNFFCHVEERNISEL